MQGCARGRGATLIGVLLAGSVPPVHAYADSDLEPGGRAIVANTGGDSILLREGPGYHHAVLALLGAGDSVTVLDDPVAGDDGSPWYQVEADGTTGYVFAEFLASPANAPADPARAPATAAARPVAAAAAGTRAISGTGGEGCACATASASTRRSSSSCRRAPRSR